ncbi:shikimate dehydrogenase [Actinobacteria bacterium YIM 96077]|uniref:Shikimate dehydrogenase n=1 Tax=Phytoactinopolyspora halophila TaxID=1981511 RepID=A0A329QXW3_9ACTN|nr:shikimate dehydrogenase [Phytoactinopolyspora halophila]AYY15010.1 shikimate dehydrogenase [Actinobacteria bacterium YIM 96077]RAW15468.1 shikimate dehydrogenase [Phytoactinopolyspora halophila]
MEPDRDADRAVRFGFIGVTASRSSINKVFPLWATELGLNEARLEPVDLALDTSRERYRTVVEDIARDPWHYGALVTSHKVRLHRATVDMFDELDPVAELTGEISCISKRAGRLRGHAKDTLTAGRSLEEFVPPGHFADGAEVLCLGAGGSGLAISLYLASRPDPSDRPDRITLVNRGAERLDECRVIHQQMDGPQPPPEFSYIANAEPEVNDQLMAELPPGSLVINATGLGKDMPGSPITDAGLFPHRGVVWEINYRGDLHFLHQARAQERERELTVEDGWRYFVHGWTAATEEVFDLELDRETVERLSSIAAEVRT